MKRIAPTVLSVLALALPLAGVVLPPPASAARSDHEVTGWILPSAANRLVRQNADGLTTLAVVGVGLRPDGASTAPVTSDMLRLARAGSHNGLRTELLVSNYSNRLGAFDPRALHRLLDRPRHIRRVTARLAAAVREGPWDGVNVDLERVRASDGPGLVRFVAALQRAMPPHRTVSIDVSASTSVRAYREHGYRLSGLARHADVVDLMAYDYSGPTWSGPGPIGPLPWQRAAVRALLRKVPAEKVQLGVAGYGYTWPETGAGRSLSPRAARRLVREDGAEAEFRRKVGEWAATLSDGTELRWSDGRSYRLRVRLAHRFGLRGTAVWRLGSADPLPRLR